MSDDATNGLSSAKPPQQQSGRPPPAAPDHSKEEDEDEKEDESARQQRELELQQLNDELAKEDPRYGLPEDKAILTSVFLAVHASCDLERSRSSAKISCQGNVTKRSQAAKTYACNR